MSEKTHLYVLGGVSALLFLLILVLFLRLSCSERIPPQTMDPPPSTADAAPPPEMAPAPQPEPTPKPTEAPPDSPASPSGRQGGAPATLEPGAPNADDDETTSSLDALEESRGSPAHESYSTAVTAAAGDFKQAWAKGGPDPDDPFFVYVKLRHNLESSCELLLLMAKYIGLVQHKQIELSEIAAAHMDAKQYQYDDNYCSHRISKAILHNAKLSLIIAEALDQYGQHHEALSKVRSSLGSLPASGRVADAGRARLTSLSWAYALRQLCRKPSEQHAIMQVQKASEPPTTLHVIKRFERSLGCIADITEKKAATSFKGGSAVSTAQNRRKQALMAATSNYPRMVAHTNAWLTYLLIVAESL